MTNIFRSLISNPLVRAQVLAQLRHLLTYGAGLLTTWLVVHLGEDQTSASKIALDVVDAVMLIAGSYFANSDVKQVDKKINAAIALSPKASADTVAALKNGTLFS